MDHQPRLNLRRHLHCGHSGDSNAPNLLDVHMSDILGSDNPLFGIDDTSEHMGHGKDCAHTLHIQYGSRRDSHVRKHRSPHIPCNEKHPIDGLHSDPPGMGCGTEAYDHEGT